MTKAVHFSSIVLDGFTSKKDKSLSLRFSTPELGDSEAVAVRALQGVVCDMLIQPSDDEFPSIEEIRTEVERKTPSARLRGALYVLYTKKQHDEDFSSWYRKQMDKIIDKIKLTIEEVEQ